MGSFKNAFDMCFDEHEAALMSLKSDLMDSIVDEIKSKELTQVEAAELMGVTQPRVSNLCTGRISRFSFDLLYVMNSKILKEQDNATQ